MATPQQPEPVLVTVGNFVRAESDRTLAGMVKMGGFGRFDHTRDPLPLDKQVAARGNRDTLYSIAVFDLAAGPVTITLPDAGERFMSMIVIDDDHYVRAVVYGPGSYTYDQATIGTRYVLMGLRMLVDPGQSGDLDQVHALQDAVRVHQDSPGRFEVPDWDQASHAKVRDALLVLNSTLPDLRGAFGSRDQVDPVRHLIATASAWGGNPDKDAVYLNITPERNDGTTVHTLTVADVPVDGFWSISVYDAEGFFIENDRGAYTLNNLTAAKNGDGSITVHFGGCDATAANCLPITAGWNYMVRLYRPRPEVQNGEWAFPAAHPTT